MEKRFTVLNHQYLNTGGNTMVSVFTVYDSTEKATRFVNVGDDTFSWQTVDTITSGDFPDGIYDECIIGNWKLDELISDPAPWNHTFEDDEFELFKYCEFEHYKADCKHFKYKKQLSVNQLPSDLYSQLPTNYIRVLEEDYNNLVVTDGCSVFIPEEYDVQKIAESKNRNDIVSFRFWLDEEVRYQPSENVDNITISVRGDSVKIPLHADSFELLMQFIDKVIEEY